MILPQTLGEYGRSGTFHLALEVGPLTKSLRLAPMSLANQLKQLNISEFKNAI